MSGSYTRSSHFKEKEGVTSQPENKWMKAGSNLLKITLQKGSEHHKFTSYSAMVHLTE